MGYYTRKNKTVNGQTVSIDKWFSTIEEAEKYAKFLGKDTVVYPAADPKIVSNKNDWN